MIQSSFKRDRLEIYYCILKSCIDDKKHTRGSLNRQVLLPYSLLNESLMYLQQAELLHIDFDKRTIKTTLKGQEYVRKFDYLMQQVGDISRIRT